MILNEYISCPKCEKSNTFIRIRHEESKVKINSLVAYIPYKDIIYLEIN